MMPITTHADEIALTAQQITDWPDAEETLARLRQRPPGAPLVFSTPPLTRTVPVCRRLALLWLDAQQIRDEDRRYAFQLVLSELLTNAIQHTRSPRVTCRMWRSGDLLHLEVRNQGGTWSIPWANRAKDANDHGRGLALVAGSARGWGRHFGAEGDCTVWATVPLARSARHAFRPGQ